MSGAAIALATMSPKTMRAASASGRRATPFSRPPAGVAACADGISEARIIIRHALKNAGIPVLTTIGTFFIGMLGGTVLVESVFALPGLGSLSVSSTTEHDLPTIQGVAIYFCLAVVIVNLIVDLLYGWLNPKARTA